MRWVLAIVIATAGCNQVFGLDNTGLRQVDAKIDAVGCSGASFVNATRLASNALGGQGVSYDPTISSDLHELWFSRDNGHDQDVVVAIESGGRYDTVDTPAQLNTTFDETDPALSADGLDLMFISRRVAANTDHLFEATRGSRGEPFGAPTLIASLSNLTLMFGFDLTVDGLSIYYSTDASSDFFVVTRPDRSSAFSLPTRVGTNVRWPGISPDEREIFYVNKNVAPGVYRRTRVDTSSTFSDVDELVDATIDDPDITPDSMTMIAVDAAAGGFELLHRDCP